MASKYTLKTKNPLCQNQSDGIDPSYTKQSDIEGWYLVATEDLGRLRWVYVNDEMERKARPQDATTKFFLEIPTVQFKMAPVLQTFDDTNQIFKI